MELKLNHVTHTYQPGSPFQATAIRDVSMTVGDGEFTALIGHTGSGKSTLAQHFNGLLKPTEGTVTLDGEDIHQKGYDRRNVRRKVGLVFQYPETQLFEESVKKDIAFGPRNLGLSDAEVEDRVRTAMAQVGLDWETEGEMSPFELSGGKMRRCAIAGVIAMRPQVLVLDEPTAGLDPEAREDMMEMVADLHRKGTAIVMVTHSMDDAARYCSRTVVLERGSIIMDDIPERIFSHAQELIDMGLDVPQVSRLGMLLRDRGIPFPENIIREEEAEKALLELFKGKGARGHA